MPEKPRRRKNNKNKRKNKNSQSNNTAKSSDVSESVDVDLCSGDEGNNEGGEKSNTEILAAPSRVEEQSTLQDESSSACEVISDSNQDLNNNSNDLQVSGETNNITNPEKLEDINLVPESNHSLDYVVESPDQSLKSKSKLSQIKSKSLDNDDAPKITELTEENSTISEDDTTLAIIDSSNVIVSDAESDVEWEKTDVLTDDNIPPSEEVTGKLSITSIPLNIAQCGQTKPLTPDEEVSLRHYLHTLNLSTHPGTINSLEIKTEIEQIINREIKQRLRKRGIDEDFFYQRIGPPRKLDVIDEEGSSESSISSRRQSYLNEKKSDNDDLEDEVFEDRKTIISKHSAKAPKTSLISNIGRLLPQQCILVDAKIKEPEISEARGNWTMKTVEKLTGAEVVYLTDSSSSTSSIYDVGEDADEGVETDVSVRMITPTIEVTDTEKLLKQTFIPPKENKVSCITEENDKLDKSKEDILKENQVDELKSDPHEIVVLSTDNIRTNLYVKKLDELDNKKISHSGSDINSNENNKTSVNALEKREGQFDLEIKVLKCELNDAINNLIKEVASDTETSNENTKEIFTRQDSSSSVSSSQCTAKYNPTCTSLTDVSNFVHDVEKINTDNIHTSCSTSHVKDVFECVAGLSTQTKPRIDSVFEQPRTLRDLCVRRVATFPYGEKILEELASVSERLQNISIINAKSANISKLTKEPDFKSKLENEKINSSKMTYYPLPDLSSIEKVSLPLKNDESVPPPIKPRNSSLKKTQDDHWTGLPTKTEPVYVCLSPSQKMLMEKTNTVITKEDASQLVDMHKKFVDRRGYKEYYNNKNFNEPSSPVVHFKSQTGSRLLALIRDPAITNNLNTSMKKTYNQSLESLRKNYSEREKKLYEPFNSANEIYSNTFKPIPPPRPKKYSSSFYESDESSDFTDNSLRSIRSERKYFHYSTGNLSKEIENDISSIQNMHRNYTNARDQINMPNSPRRPSLPKDLCDQQMEYIRRKEKEVEDEIRRIEQQKLNISQKRGPRAPLITEKEVIEEKIIDPHNYSVTRKKDISYRSKSPGRGVNRKLTSLFSSSQEEILRDKMYSEYVNQIAERQERKQNKVIKITNTSTSSATSSVSKSMSALDVLDSKVNNKIEKEFICKARERWDKLGIKDPETEDERGESKTEVYREPKVIEHKIKVLEGGEERDVKKLPSHLQEFVRFTATDKDKGTGSPGESSSGPAAPHVVVLCAVIIIVLAVGKFFLRLFRSK